MTSPPDFMSVQQLDTYVKAVLERKARDVVLLDMRELTTVADAFLICSGTSNRQVTAIADSVQRTLKKQGIKPLSIEGKRDGHWVLMDYGPVIIHVFYGTVREFYDLEGLWRDATRVTTPSMESQEKAKDEGVKDGIGMILPENELLEGREPAMTDAPCMLIILDGWGINPEKKGNAVIMADTPVLTGLKKDYPVTRLSCSGEAVGLPAGVMGNSEVGHLNIGAGRVVFQDLMRINKAVEDGSFFGNEAILKAMADVKRRGAVLHLMGLASDSGVHSDLPHLFAILEMAARQGIDKVCVHAITDGRDSPPDSGVGYIRRIQETLEQVEMGVIASICGRYYAMDRDKRWERTEQAYGLYTRGQGVTAADPVAAVKDAYGRGETDEFIRPVVLVDGNHRPRGVIGDGDGVVFFNFRADRARQITRALTDDAFGEFDRPAVPDLGGFVCMTLYDETFTLPMAFPPVTMKNILGEIISRSGCKQLRIAETEKYAHVTYFFNGGEETPFPDEDRCLVPSPREVATYDLKPEMSAREVTGELLERMRSGKYDFIAVNFANMDMVGHTGILSAAIEACETVDACVGEILEQLTAMGGTALVTADHGNAEKMMEADGSPHTAHTLNQVPLILVDEARKDAVLREEGILGDIAPTILEIMGIERPLEMTGRSLIKG